MKLKPIPGHYAPAVESRAHQAWRAMIARCHNPSNGSYHNYGGRGISVCERWRGDFLAFLSDMGEPGAGLSIDRIDNENGYSPENCRWATRKEQGNNRRTCRYIEYNGEKMTVMQASNLSGISHANILQRINAGWPPERIFVKPKVYTKPSKAQKFLVLGEMLNVKELSVKFGLEYNLIRKRVERGISGDDLISKSKRPYRFRPS